VPVFDHGPVYGQHRRVTRTKITRLPELASSDRAALDDLLDSTLLAHVALCGRGRPLVIPTAFVRHGDRLLIHGSTGSGWMRALASGEEASVAVTAVDGLVVARSAFESSIRYRSAVLFGRFAEVDASEKDEVLRRLTDGLLPGRTAEVRASTAKELAATMVLSLPIEEWSLKISDGWPEDEAVDVAGPAWAGVVPMTTTYGEPLPAPDLRDGIPVPASVRRLADRTT
jgi:nitroimidazol reductase NimA-like FMN-containing flavoprotein (pyridoxamine 5'-phosphate oxidase superfamily)